MAENVWDVSVVTEYVSVIEDGEPSNQMYTALVWVGSWSWQEDLPDNKIRVVGEVNDQVKAELATSPNVTLLSAVLRE